MALASAMVGVIALGCYAMRTARVIRKMRDDVLGELLLRHTIWAAQDLDLRGGVFALTTDEIIPDGIFFLYTFGEFLSTVTFTTLMLAALEGKART